MAVRSQVESGAPVEGPDLEEPSRVCGPDNRGEGHQFQEGNVSVYTIGFEELDGGSIPDQFAERHLEHYLRILHETEVAGDVRDRPWCRDGYIPTLSR